jgi:hypothetical protein
MIYLVLGYKYTEYKIFQYTQTLAEINTELSVKIDYTKELLDYKNTKAYKNRIQKSEQ